MLPDDGLNVHNRASSRRLKLRFLRHAGVYRAGFKSAPEYPLLLLQHDPCPRELCTFQWFRPFCESRVVNKLLQIKRLPNCQPTTWPGSNGTKLGRWCRHLGTHYQLNSADNQG